MTFCEYKPNCVKLKDMLEKVVLDRTVVNNFYLVSRIIIFFVNVYDMNDGVMLLVKYLVTSGKYCNSHSETMVDFS